MEINIVKGKIGNALTSTAANHVVAVSQDIYDENVNKYQSDINRNLENKIEEEKAAIIETNRIADTAVTNKKLSTDIQSLISNLSKTATFAGIAIPATNPGTPEGPVFYIANGKGTYTNFGGIDITEDEAVIIYYDTNWHKITTGIASQEKLIELNEKVNSLALGKFYGYFPNSSSLPVDITISGYAYVGLDSPYKIWNFNGESWSDSGTSIDINDADEEDITRNANGKLKFKDRVYGDGMGYIILRKNKSFAEQVTKANTIYEIRYEFDLGNAEVSIPEGCVLQFNGGLLKDGIINFQETRLSGEPHIITDFKGSIKNKEINISWFGVSGNPNFDNAPIISKVINTFKRGTLHSGTYYIKSPIVFDNIVDSPGHINLDCTIIYNGIGGTNEKYLECITFESFYGGNLYIKELINNSNYCTGIRFCKGKRNTITINEIIGFNYGVVCSPKTNEGFSENYFYIKEIQSHGICTHLVLDGATGWVNANIFYNTYFGTDKKENNNVTGILLKSGASYKPSTNIFNNISFEWNDKCIILDNALHNYFINVRTENCPNIITAKGCSYNNFVSLTYYSNSTYPFISFVDMSEQQDGWLWGTLVNIHQRMVTNQISTDVSFVDKYKRCTPIQENGYFIGIIEDFVFSSGYHRTSVAYIGNNIVNHARMKIDSGIILGYGDFVGRLIDTSNCKELYFTASTSSSEFRCFCVYIEENGVELLTNKDKKPPRVSKNVSWDDSFDMFDIGSLNSDIVYNLVVPESITKICLLIRSIHVETDILKGLSIMGSHSSVPFVTLNAKIDTPKDSITYPYIGQLNMSDGYPIWWTGTKWINATGTDV